MGERMRPKPGHHKQEPHRKPSCASRDYWTTQFVGLISIALTGCQVRDVTDTIPGDLYDKLFTDGS